MYVAGWAVITPTLTPTLTLTLTSLYRYVAGWAVITVFPALSLSFDKDVSERAAHLFPALYTEGQLGQALSLRTFGRWALMGASQSLP